MGNQGDCVSHSIGTERLSDEDRERLKTLEGYCKIMRAIAYTRMTNADSHATRLQASQEQDEAIHARMLVDRLLGEWPDPR